MCLGGRVGGLQRCATLEDVGRVWLLRVRRRHRRIRRRVRLLESMKAGGQLSLYKDPSSAPCFASTTLLSPLDTYMHTEATP